MPATTFVADDDILEAETATALRSGDIVLLPSRLAGQALTDIPAGTTGAFRTRGRIKATKHTASDMRGGDIVDWDVATQTVYQTGTVGDYHLGRVEFNAPPGETEVYVLLNR